MIESGLEAASERIAVEVVCGQHKVVMEIEAGEVAGDRSEFVRKIGVAAAGLHQSVFPDAAMRQMRDAVAKAAELGVAVCLSRDAGAEA